ncbi:MAG: DEAD/DEAH box helicase [Deltaproteobacteria bacterium]|nr:MAG: DEAD/DEAH box helicase [Deltaproteobacteria bacterium]
MAASTPDLSPEALARLNIDAALEAAGWAVQDRAEMNVAAKLGVAIREFKTDAGFADYLLYVDRKPAGIIEAKKKGVVLTGIEAQTKDYASKVPSTIPVPIRPLPFLYESTGVETRFTNLLDPKPRSRGVFHFHQPETLKRWLDDAIAIKKARPGAPVAATFLGRMQEAPTLNAAGMWPAQSRAVENLEKSIREGRPRALIQMATGSGKTYTAIAALYRLIKFGGARRVLFLVDRGNLGRQAYKEFQAYTAPDDGRKFTELYNVTRLTSNKIDPVNRVVITTIQRLYSILKGEPEYNDELEEGSAFNGSGSALVREPPPVVYSPYIPPEFFDVLVVDECHRSIYTLWRQVIEYFDASIIGLTATPAKHTFAFFRKNVVSEYRHEHAVRDRVNVPFEVYKIQTRVTREGGTLEVSESDPVVVGKRDRQTREVRWETLDEDITYSPRDLDRSVVVTDQIRTVIREFRDKLFTEIFPGRTEIPKTLFFAKNDHHAEDILEVIREEFAIGNEEAVKVTYKPERQLGDGTRHSASHRPEDVIQRFRNSYQPRIAVTVDMIATGTDIKPLECVVFMRSVKSRGLFEQMKGRGVRVMPDSDFQAITRDATVKTHFVIVDAVGVMDEQKSDPPLIRSRGISFEALLELVRAGNRDEAVLANLAGRLDRMERKLNGTQAAAIQRANNGESLRAIVARLLDALDPDKEDAKARELHNLADDAQPTVEQVKDAQEELREAAAAPLAYNPTLCQTILEVRRQQEQVIDDTTADTVVDSGPKPGHQIDYDAALIQSFQTFITAHRDEIDALQILYTRPYSGRLRREQIKELADAIRLPERQWTTERLWAAYQRVDADRVKGASEGRLWTDIVALARHAMYPNEDLVPYADEVNERFTNWLAQQANRGRTFSAEQTRWLELIRDRIAGDVEVRMEDFDQVPLINAGGLGGFFEVFGDEYEAIVAELNERLVA